MACSFQQFQMDVIHENAQVAQGNDVKSIDTVMQDTQETNNASSNSNPKRRRKLTSNVWSKFEVLPLGSDKKQRAKCLRCGITYLCSSMYGTGNLKRHMASCMKQLDLGQLVVSHNDNGSLITRSSRFDPNKFYELLVELLLSMTCLFSLLSMMGLEKCSHIYVLISS
ncbi:uncharacterized protein LOC126799913 [Argentina anserina]|uniref:uncharacterized protein LOC126799913 n=1 Tax=Argentina anserina TaxID=57926 RepID=UPI0021763DA7|nr:uncharacterized protein LOC126799913 [Potentilla anserina]